jgi:hypothetical protein
MQNSRPRLYFAGEGAYSTIYWVIVRTVRLLRGFSQRSQVATTWWPRLYSLYRLRLTFMKTQMFLPGG